MLLNIFFHTLPFVKSGLGFVNKMVRIQNIFQGMFVIVGTLRMEMISDSYHYRDLLSSFVSQHILEANVFGGVWETVKDVMDVFKVFNDATYTFSHVYKPTSNLFCYTALNIAGTIDSGLKVPSIANAVMGMRAK